MTRRLRREIKQKSCATCEGIKAPPTGITLRKIDMPGTMQMERHCRQHTMPAKHLQSSLAAKLAANTANA